MRWPSRRSKVRRSTGLGDRLRAGLLRVGAILSTGIRRLDPMRGRRRGRRSFGPFGIRFGGRR